MPISICCRELGIDCDFAIEDADETEPIVTFMRHVIEDHAEDWIDAEEIHMTAFAAIRGKAA